MAQAVQDDGHPNQGADVSGDGGVSITISQKPIHAADKKEKCVERNAHCVHLENLTVCPDLLYQAFVRLTIFVSGPTGKGELSFNLL